MLIHTWKQHLLNQYFAHTLLHKTLRIPGSLAWRWSVPNWVSPCCSSQVVLQALCFYVCLLWKYWWNCDFDQGLICCRNIYSNISKYFSAYSSNSGPRAHDLWGKVEGFVQLRDDIAKLSLLLAVNVVRINHDKLQVGRFSLNILKKKKSSLPEG